jgi:clan AA aspartic protease (TIGR02281 family)
MSAKASAGQLRRGVRPIRASQRKKPVVPAVSPLLRGGRVVVALACVFAGIAGAGLFREYTPGSRDHARADPQMTDQAALKRLAGRLDRRGQCYVNGLIDGETFSLLVDSGASSLLFYHNHLPRLGVDPRTLRFNRTIATANGTSHAAGFVLHEVRLGGFVLHDVPALVGDANGKTGDDAPLLGMSVLKLMHLEIGGGACALLWQ